VSVGAVERWSPEAEAALVDAARAGDERAFTCLYDRYLDRVYNHLYYRTGNRDDAEDLTQQVFLQAWRALGRYRRTETPFIGWLLTIAHHTFISFYRRSKRHPHIDPEELEPIASGAWSDPETAALAQGDRMALREAILKLRPDQQQVITMRFIDQFDYAAIAAALQKHEGTVRVITHRALLELRRLLGEEGKG
jgi:RNA polymerase sigma-70 factor (ECF subfamily)